MAWTEERIETASNLWLEGRSASEIAKLLGVTRNAIIGKVHRLGLKRYEATTPYATDDGLNSRQRWAVKRAATAAETRGPKPPKAPKPAGWQTKTRREPTKPIAPPVLLTGAEKPWIERKNGECCYPIGEGADMLMCCQKASEATRNLCAYHFPICYVVGSAMKPKDVRHYERKAA